MMRKEKKGPIIDRLVDTVSRYPNFYLTSIEALDAEGTAKLRRECSQQDVKLVVVKNALFKKALEKADGDFSELDPVLKGNTAVMFSSSVNAPAKLIKKFSKDYEIPKLKAAYVDAGFYIGEENLDLLSTLKSKEELIADIIVLLQSPVKNVVSALQSSGQKISGVLETLSKREN